MISFEKKVLFCSWVIDSLSLALILFYSIMSSWIPSSQTFLIIKTVVPTFAVFLAVAVPLVSHLSCKNISRKLMEFDETGGDERMRTSLLLDIHRQPKICLYTTTAYFMATFIISFVILRPTLKVSVLTGITILIEWLCGSYFAGLIAYSIRRRLCRPYAVRLVKKGINEKFATSRRNFGFSLRTQIMLYILIPLLLTTTVTVSLYSFTLPWGQKSMGVIATEALNGQSIGLLSQQIPDSPSTSSPSERLRESSTATSGSKPFIGMTRMWNWRIKSTSLLNAIIMCVQILIFYLSFMNKNKKSIDGLEALINSRFTGGNTLASDMNDELSYNIYLINSLILKFQTMISDSISIARMITDSSSSLTKIADTTEKNADNQSSKTSRIITEMDSNKKLSADVDTLANEVASSAQATASDMDLCAQIMQKTRTSMQDIGNSNSSTLNSIKELQQKVSSIWEIVNLINSIAEQTKIIAFNTELESSGLSTEDKSFLNVALETRRLANSIADATKEIKDYIRQIEATEAQLLKHSASNTDEIERGLELSNSIEASFAGVNELSNLNAAATKEIKDMVRNQTVAFGQIQDTLIQVGAGIRNFTLSASSLVNATGELNSSASNLGMGERYEK